MHLLLILKKPEVSNSVHTLTIGQCLRYTACCVCLSLTLWLQQYWISETAPTWAIFRMNEQLLICRLAWHHFGRYFGDNWKPKTSQIWFLYICSKIWDLASDLLQIEAWLHYCPALNPALNWIILSLEFLSTRDQDRQSSSSDRKDDDLHKAYLSFLMSSKV